MSEIRIFAFMSSKGAACFDYNFGKTLLPKIFIKSKSEALDSGLW